MWGLDPRLILLQKPHYIHSQCCVDPGLPHFMQQPCSCEVSCNLDFETWDTIFHWDVNSLCSLTCGLYSTSCTLASLLSNKSSASHHSSALGELPRDGNPLAKGPLTFDFYSGVNVQLMWFSAHEADRRSSHLMSIYPVPVSVLSKGFPGMKDWRMGSSRTVKSVVVGKLEWAGQTRKGLWDHCRTALSCGIAVGLAIWVGESLRDHLHPSPLLAPAQKPLDPRSRPAGWHAAEGQGAALLKPMLVAKRKKDRHSCKCLLFRQPSPFAAPQGLDGSAWPSHPHCQGKLIKGEAFSTGVRMFKGGREGD